MPFILYYPSPLFRTVRIFLSLLIALMVATPLSAQTSPKQVFLHVTLPDLLHLDTADPNVHFPSLRVSDIKDGYVTALSPTKLDATGNVAHVLAVKADQTQFYSQDGTPTGKPISDLELSLDGGATWASLRDQYFSLPTPAAQKDSKAVYEIHYRLRLRPGFDRPGTYVIPLSFVLIHP